MGGQLRWGLAIAILAAIFFAFPAFADDRAACVSKDPDTSIEGCSAIIDAGTETAAIIALAYHLRGAAYHGKGEYDRAIKDYDRAIALAPENAGMYNDRAVAYKSSGDNNRAFADYDRAIELDPKMAKAYFNRGIHNGQQGNHDKAIKDFERATALNTEYVEAFYMRGLMYAHQRDYSGAMKDYDRALALNPEYVEAIYARGYIYEEQGNTVKAVAAYRKALALRPDLALAREGLARFGISIVRYPGEALRGEAYETSDAEDFEACEARCLTVGECKAYSFMKGSSSCQLFSSVREYSEQAGVDSGVKQVER